MKDQLRIASLRDIATTLWKCEGFHMFALKIETWSAAKDCLAYECMTSVRQRSDIWIAKQAAASQEEANRGMQIF